jgi:glucosyl-3-phosphoglycerate phosphatase
VTPRSPTRIFLARHGEAAYPTSGSGDSGGALTALGRSQARALGERLRNDERPAAIVCSELSRAIQTAEIASEVLQLPVQVQAGLQEYDVGDERGKPYNAGLFEPLLLAWLKGDLSVGIPGGEDGHQVARRMFAALDDLADRFQGEAVLAVSHGGAIIATLGSIAPGHPGLPRDGNDVPGGASYTLEQSSGSWRAFFVR